MLRQKSLRSGKSTPEVGLTYPVARVFPGETVPTRSLTSASRHRALRSLPGLRIARHGPWSLMAVDAEKGRSTAHNGVDMTHMAASRARALVFSVIDRAASHARA